jgi:hypothetical protein
MLRHAHRYRDRPPPNAVKFHWRTSAAILQVLEANIPIWWWRYANNFISDCIHDVTYNMTSAVVRNCAPMKQRERIRTDQSDLSRRCGKASQWWPVPISGSKGQVTRRSSGMLIYNVGDDRFLDTFSDYSSVKSSCIFIHDRQWWCITIYGW